MKSPLVLAALALGLAAMAAAGADPTQDATDRLLFRLNAGRGVGGVASPGVTAPPIADATASALGARLAAQPRVKEHNAGATPAPVRPAAERQRAGLQRLSTMAGPALEVHLRPENGTVRQIRGGVLAKAAAGPAKAGLAERAESTARGFLQLHGDLLRVVAPGNEFALERSEPEDAGGRRLRFEQRHGNLPVWPAHVALHLDAKGDVVLLEGAYVPSPAQVPVEPLITPVAAVLRARASVPGGMRGEGGKPELIVYAPLDREPRLGWRFALNVGMTQGWRFVVDARDGRLLLRQSSVCDANVAGQGTDLQGAQRPLNVWQSGASHYLIDTSKAMFNPQSDPIQQPQGVITIADAQLKPANELQSSDILLITSATSGQWPFADGVSAAFNFSQTYDYFSLEHGRNSLDGEGGNITAIVRVGDYNNASWNGNLRVMLFGTVQPYAGALDVVGHELTHGLTETSAGLVYENQSGAMNESFSDIFGEMVEARVEGQPDWKMGTRLNQIIRDLKAPGALVIPGLNRPFPSKMSEFIQLPNTSDADHGGVHFNSSILNHCFWQLAEGLPGAVGRRDAERIFFSTLTQHLLPQSQFIDARLGAMAAAEALFGRESSQVRKVAEAFDAVEILAAPETPEPTPVPVVQGPDSTLFIAADPILGDLGLYRRETAQGDAASGTTFADEIGLSRPAVTGDGQLVLFVDGNFDLCAAETGNPASRECLNFPGLVHSVAVSPDGRYGAFVLRNPDTGEADNRISLVDLVDGTTQTFELLAPLLDGVPIDGVLQADSMSFSTDSQVLYYDAQSRLRFGSGPTVERWSVYALHLDTGKISIVVPPVEGVDTGNPMLGRAGTRYLVFDAFVESVGNSAVVVLDLFTGQAERVGIVEGGVGFPALTGDESGVIYAQADATVASGASLMRQELADNRLGVVGLPSLWIEDAALGVLYRRGSFSGTNALPTVVILAPAPGSTLEAGAPVAITAEATDGAGGGASIARVEFYEGDLKLGEDLSAPFSFTWTPAGPGPRRLIARAFDALGAAGDSPPIPVTVVGEPTAEASHLRIQARPDGSVRLVLQGPPGNYVISQTSDFDQWADIYPAVIDASGQTTIDDSGGPAHSSILFYRARKD